MNYLWLRKKAAASYAWARPVCDLVEAVAQVTGNGSLQPFEGWVDLFILPGYQFRVVDAMVTNFHLPKSTLLMLVSAFAGKELIDKAYQNRYR